ncbi:MAG TPA: hypothetical protein VLI90_14205 [Tepidisphaeraceae bacterium]|nr:hypothetical protein [Tepidisphaeraceae bacterium]
METSHIPHRSQTPSSDPLTSGGGEPPGDRQVCLSETQQQALEWLTNGGSVTEAAQFAGVARNTVSRWLHNDPDFRAVYDAWIEQTALVSTARMAAVQESAVDVLIEAIRQRRDARVAMFVVKQTMDARKK